MNESKLNEEQIVAMAVAAIADMHDTPVERVRVKHFHLVGKAPENTENDHRGGLK